MGRSSTQREVVSTQRLPCLESPIVYAAAIGLSVIVYEFTIRDQQKSDAAMQAMSDGLIKIG